jgi:predicted PurR-regulated permease PerM
MTETHRDLLSAAFSLILIALAAFVMHRFFLPLIWAGILCVATWPLYERMRRRFGQHDVLAAAALTLLMLALFMVPLALGVTQAARQAPELASYLVTANTEGIPVPAVLQHLPMVGDWISDWWQATLNQPHGLAHLLSEHEFNGLHSASDLIKIAGAGFMHRAMDFGLAFLCLFFFYKDGAALSAQIHAIGSHCVSEERWAHFAAKIPTAIRATVNGLVLVGLAEGVLIGIAYALAGLHSPAVWAAVTGILAIIPFGAPLAFLTAAAILASQGAMAAAVAVAVWGSIVLFVADHFVRPGMIGNATRLPFLAVLFGILGGVETLGLVGLFIGPVIMVLFVTLWYEAKLFDDGRPVATPR